MCKLAIDKLNNTFIKGKSIQVKQSINKRKLFIGNLPKKLTKEQFTKIVNDKTEGCNSIDFLINPSQPSKNRGFAFLEYQDYYQADLARRIFSNPLFKFSNDYDNETTNNSENNMSLTTTLTVNWSDTETTFPLFDNSENNEIKSLYVKNIALEYRKQDQIIKLFNDIINENSLFSTINGNRGGELVEKVIIPPNFNSTINSRDYAFVHFKTRELAEEILNYHENKPINFGGRILSISFAKPIVDKKQRIDKIQRNNNIHNNIHSNNLLLNNNNSFPILPFNNNNNNFNINTNLEQLLQHQQHQQHQFLNFYNNNSIYSNNNIDYQYVQLLQHQQNQQLYFNSLNNCHKGLRYSPY